MAFLSPPNDPIIYMNIGIFTIVKNEQDYLEEWLQYHLSTFPDLTKIYVFDDPFSKSHKGICDKFPKDKVISNSILTLFPKNRQESILNKTDYRNSKYPRQTTYMYQVLDYLKSKQDLDCVFYIDVDEFLTLERPSTLTDIFSPFNNYDIVVIQWMNFGANGHIHTPNRTTFENYTTLCPLAVGTMSLGAASKECFNLHRWNPRRILTNHHAPSKARWCKTNFHTDYKEIVYDKIYIRHYITKSFEEFAYKIFIRGQFFGSKTLNSFFAFNPDISKQNPDVQKILNSYKERYFSGELVFRIQ